MSLRYLLNKGRKLHDNVDLVRAARENKLQGVNVQFRFGRGHSFAERLAFVDDNYGPTNIRLSVTFEGIFNGRPFSLSTYHKRHSGMPSNSELVHKLMEETYLNQLPTIAILEDFGALEEEVIISTDNKGVTHQKNINRRLGEVTYETPFSQDVKKFSLKAYELYRISHFHSINSEGL